MQRLIRTAIISIFVASIAAVPAAAIELGEGTRLGLNGTFAAPVWSPDGSGLALAGSDYNGLYFTDLFGNLSQISDAPMSGWRPSWSPDGQSIAFRTRDEIGMGMQMNVAGRDGESKPVSPTLNDLIPGTWGKDGLTYRSGDELITVDKDGKVVRVYSLSQGRGLLARIASVAGSMMMGQVTGSTFTAFGLLMSSQRAEGLPAESGVYVDSDNQVWIVDEHGNKKKLIDVDGEHGYFNPVESADGKYAVSGLSGNLYVTDPRTGDVLELGNGSNPTWSPDGRGLIFERTTDDGHQLTSSDLWYYGLDGTAYQLTNTPEIETQASWSPDGNSLVYIIDGVVYVAPIE